LAVTQEDRATVTKEGKMPAMQQYAYDVFISHSFQDREQVDDIVYLLEQTGINVWIDRRRIKYQQIVPEIQFGIDQSRYFAFFLSSNTRASQWLEHEAKYFRQSRGNEEPLPLLLVKLSDGELPPSLADLVPPRIVHYIDCTESLIDGFVELIQVFSHNAAGILRYYPRNEIVSPRLWDTLISHARREISIMGHSMAGTFTGGRDTSVVLKALKKHRVRMRFILLIPSSPRLQQLREVQVGLDPGVDLEYKINRTIDRIQRLKGLINDAGNDSQLQIRVTDRIMYSTTYLCDSLGVITNYSSIGETGNNSPAFLVSEHTSRSEENESLYSFYIQEFERYWKAGIHPEEDRRMRRFNDSTRILEYKAHISEIERWMSNQQQELPLPSELIIYPTYRCSTFDEHGNDKLLCANCSYKEKLRQVGTEDLQLHKLCQIIDDVVKLGIRHIQFSGGGEPLQYQDIDGLLEFLIYIKGKNKNVLFGLMTNGLYLKPEIIPKIASIFSYVRLSYAEGILCNHRIDQGFVANLRLLLQAVCSSATPRMGLKLLLSHSNGDAIIDKLVALRHELGERMFRRIEHIRVKAMRSFMPNTEPNKQDSAQFRSAFYDLLFTHPQAWPEDIQVDLDLGYVDEDFICRLSPLFAVVDPCGALLSCCNYLNAYNDLKIGDLTKEGFCDVWGSVRHRELVKSINPARVCNARNGCPCRFAKYQAVLDNHPHGDVPLLPPSIVSLL
jgi:sulfatase maturation enzyme AslB (radical SAM superfamily)